MNVITRFAPSPTGNPHVGNIRTALFAYLFARSQKGKFLLRIEDTDRNRFVPESLEYIENSLKWLGLDYDGEKVFQSDRLPTYAKMAEVLIEKGFAYKCFCSPERLTKLRSEQEKAKKAPGYDGHCRSLSKKEISGYETAGDSYVIRFKMPTTGKASWKDLVRGEVEIGYDTQDDPIILKSDGWPTYHLANVIDDHEMGITHVIRGEEWIPSTPKHIALYDAFGWAKPIYAHLPVILGPDKAKLSKRHGDTAILDYREAGYLPDAMVNFLVTLGWNDGTEDEIFSMAELVKRFDLSRVQKAPAVFDIAKLNWLNGMYIRKATNGNLADLIESLYPKAEISKSDRFDRILEVEKTRLNTLADILEGNDYFLQEPKNFKGILIFRKSDAESTKKGLAGALERLTEIAEKEWDNLTTPDFEKILKGVVEKEKLTNGDVFWPIRVALSGVEKSPAPTELLWVLGKEESVKRINNSLGVLRNG